MASYLKDLLVLCSNLNTNSLIGVEKDSEETILVTTKGFVKRHNIVNFDRQVITWPTTSWNPFTCAAIYDLKLHEFLAVVKHSSLISWKEETENIVKEKGIHFKSSIHKLLVCANCTYVVYSGGYIETLDTAKVSHKVEKSKVLSDTEDIFDAWIIDNGQIGIIVSKTADTLYRIHKLQLGKAKPDCSSADLDKSGCLLRGICVLSTGIIVLLWSNGELGFFDSHKSLEDPWGTKSQLIQVIKTSHWAKLIELSPWHIAIIGLDNANEGGVLAIWDVQFSFVTSYRKLKMYQDPPKGWVVPNKGLVVLEGGALAYFPCTVAKSNLASLFGSRSLVAVHDFPEGGCLSWDQTNGIKGFQMEAEPTVFTEKSERLCEVIKMCSSCHSSENILAHEVISKLLLNRDLVLICETLDVFHDIPEQSLVNILHYFLTESDSVFENIQVTPPMLLQLQGGDEDKLTRLPFNAAKSNYINKVFLKSFTSSELRSALPQFSFPEALPIMQYLLYLLMAGLTHLDIQNSSLPCLRHIIIWLSLLIETHFSQIVLTSETIIQKMLLAWCMQAEKLKNRIEGLAINGPLARRILDAKSISSRKSSGPYSIEKIVYN